MPASQLVLGTHNGDKVRELRKLLRGSGIRVLSLEDFPGCPEAVENGKSFEENARLKARLYAKHCRRLTLADDSGLEVSALGGRPGVYSARFAGRDCTYRDNNRKLLRLMRKVPDARRRARFVCAVAVYDGPKKVGTVRGECAGRIAFEERGGNGFGYDPVFIPRGFRKTYAELSPAAKNRTSHRGKALRAARRLILRYISKK